MNGSVRVEVSPGRAEVAPGASVSLTVRVVNGTSIVDEFAVEVVGAAAGWSAVDRPRVSLLPDQAQTVVVTLSPPLQQPPPAGSRTAGVKVASVTQPHATWVEEFAVDVAPIAAAALDVRPRQARGGRSARFTVGILNQGNVPLHLTLHGEDPEQVVAFRFDAPSLDVPPGARAETQVQVSAGRAWTGADVPRPLTVWADGSPQPLSATASFVQRSRLAGGFVKAAGTLATVALVGIAVFVASRLAGGDPVDDQDLVGVIDDEDDGQETTEQESFIIPPVVGMPRAQAVHLLRTSCPGGADCLDVFVVQQFDDDVAEDRVLGIEPPEQAPAQLGQPVTLTVSLGGRPFVTPPAGAPLAGVWTNEDPQTGAFTQLEIEQRSDAVIVHAFEHCTPDDCDLGVALGTPEPDPGNPGGPHLRGTIEWDHVAVQRTMTLTRIAGGRMNVTVVSRFPDGRPPTQDDYTFESVRSGPGGLILSP